MAKNRIKTNQDSSDNQLANNSPATTGKEVNFLGNARKICIAISAALIIISIISIVTRGFNLGIDFTGGSVVEVVYDKQVDLQPIRDRLAQEGYTNFTVQNFGTSKNALIKIQDANANKNQISEQLIALLKDIKELQNNTFKVLRVEFIGPQVGKQLTEDGALAVLYALIGILLYVALRFEYRFSLASVVALVHDVTITLGFFALFRIQFDLTVLAAILAIIGYSLNDTIVVFDRIREIFLSGRAGSDRQLANTALNQTLSRTLMTSITTLLVVLSLLILGGETIKDFALALLIGIIIGTYSSIFIATVVALSLGASRENLFKNSNKIKKEDLEEEARKAFLQAEQNKPA